MNNRKGILAAALYSSLVGLSHAIELPEGFVDETFIGGFDGQITGFDPLSPGRIFVSEKSGIVRVVANGELLAEPFLDISDIVNDRVDRGMLSVAVHPQFPQTPYVYLLYTYDPPELVTNNLTGSGVQNGNGNRVSRLARYTADASQDFNVALAGSETIILGKNSTFAAIGNAEEQEDTLTPSCGPIGDPTEDCLPIDEITHTIGAMRFAADGSLYVTNGDGASYVRENAINPTFNPLSQMTYDLNSLRGKILRIDPDTGLGLADNPFFDGNPSSNRSRVVSYGLRNPYSMTLHPFTGVPYVGEVGDRLWEEINGGVGKNFGWPCFEGGPDGNLRQAGYEPQSFCQNIYRSNEAIEAPLLSWEHGETGNNAAMLGDFYFGEVFPEQYMGKLFYGDFIRGWLRFADVSNPDSVTSNEFATGMLPMTEMRTGEDGALYYASITTGEIRRIRYVGDSATTENPANQTPENPNTDIPPTNAMSPTPTPDPDPDLDPELDGDGNGNSTADPAEKKITVGNTSFVLILMMSIATMLRRQVKSLRVAR